MVYFLKSWFDHVARGRSWSLMVRPRASTSINSGKVTFDDFFSIRWSSSTMRLNVKMMSNFKNKKITKIHLPQFITGTNDLQKDPLIFTPSD